jgi:hypothetical protein
VGAALRGLLLEAAMRLMQQAPSEGCETMLARYATRAAPATATLTKRQQRDEDAPSPGWLTKAARPVGHDAKRR